jgi:hypothetical protein
MPMAKKVVKKAAKRVAKKAPAASLAKKVSDLERVMAKLVKEVFPNGTPTD